ncbi:HEAT repeat domain-containing protein [Candidatus Poribacteria bacterium]|nr:HEAT repeat domain-containing protein [Candidatus Poribacteria bacterium]
MKKFSTLLIFLILAVSVGCEQEQPITQLEVGKNKLLNAGLAIEAVNHLKRAEIEEAKTEAEKVEPRALLLIAYSYAIFTGDAKTQEAEIPGLEAEYKQAREERIATLSSTEMKKILQLLAERHRTQDATIQILVDKGADAAPVLLEYLGTRRYMVLRPDLIEILYQIGSEAIDHLTAALKNAETSPEMKMTLTQLIGRINDPRAIPALEAVQSGSTPGLRMEINIALYNLGKQEYRTEIINGLNDNDVEVRRAAAQAMLKLDDPPVDEIVNALKDLDPRVRMYAAQTLKQYPTEKAIDRLIEILVADTDESAREAAGKALIVHASQDFGQGIARQLIQALPTVSDPKERIRIVLVLKKDALIKQIKNAPRTYDSNIELDLYLYSANVEQNDMVKEELSMLLNTLGR